MELTCNPATLEYEALFDVEAEGCVERGALKSDTVRLFSVQFSQSLIVSDLNTHIGSCNKNSSGLTEEGNQGSHKSSLSVRRLFEQVNPRRVKCSVKLELCSHLEEFFLHIFLVLICRVVMELADNRPRFFGPSPDQEEAWRFWGEI